MAGNHAVLFPGVEDERRPDAPACLPKAATEREGLFTQQKAASSGRLDPASNPGSHPAFHEKLDESLGWRLGQGCTLTGNVSLVFSVFP